MHRSRVFSVLTAIGVITTTLFITLRPRGASGSEPTVADFTVVQPSSLAPSQAVPSATPQPDSPTATSPVPPTAVPQIPDDQPTPLSAYADQLQTPLPPAAQQPESDRLVVEGWNPPPLEVPIARQRFDHYWMIRPVAPNNSNFGLSYYPFGSNGPGDNLRIHHGTDLANPIGVEVFAAADGTVIWADKGHFNEYESITAYGNTVVIQHDFGFEGETVYTLYAHLSAFIVTPGQYVHSGDVIGLIGATGQVSGPHVHFEVRIGRDSYYSVYNPDLWIAPYAGTGVVAGRVALENGDPAYDGDVTLINLSTGRIVRQTTTYAGFGVNGDVNWNENFAIPDVPSGHYLVAVRHGGQLWSDELDVIVGTTNWAELAPADPDSIPLPDDSTPPEEESSPPEDQTPPAP
jgi:murein DD-endopeptidase MepM/ murein hydrolase activator NlpD